MRERERERLEAERLEAERLEAERLEAERLEAERLEGRTTVTEHVDELGLARRRSPYGAWREHNRRAHGQHITSPVASEAERDHAAAHPTCQWRP